MKMFGLQDNTHQRSATVREALCKLVDNMTQPADSRQTFSPALQMLARECIN